MEGGVKIAKRRRYTRAKSAVRRYTRSGSAFKPIVDGVIGGVAAEAGQKFLGNWGAPVGVGVAGFFLKNSTLKTIAGLQIGGIIGEMIPGISTGSSAVGGVY